MEEKQTPEVQKIMDEITKQLRETIAESFIDEPNSEENREKLKNLFKEYFGELTEISRVYIDITLNPGPEDE